LTKLLRLGGILASAAVIIVLAVLKPFHGTKAQTLTPFANFEGAQTSPIRLSPDGTRLFAVNTPNASVSVFDVTQAATPKLIAQIPVGLEPVSVNPRTDDEAWVVNQESDSISVVSVSKGIVTDTIYAKDEPMDVVFAGSSAYVSVSRSNQVRTFDVNTHALTGIVPLFGGNPRALTVSPDGTKVYVAFALSGNATTLIFDPLAPPQPQPGQSCGPNCTVNPALPPPPQVGLIVKYNDPAWTKDISFSMPDNDVAIISTGTRPALQGYYSGLGTINLGIAANPVTGDLFVSNTDALNLIHFEDNLQGHFVNNRITRVQVSTGAVTPFDMNPAINYSVLPNPAALSTALAQPTAITFDPSGSFMYVAAYGTDRVAVVDINGNVLSRIEVALPSGQGTNVDPKNKRGPRGLALNAAAQKLYVMNRISNTISIVDTSQRALIGEIVTGADPTPLIIKSGRGFLYDAKLSGNGTGSCASCHIDGDMDHLSWDLGDPDGNMSTLVEGTTTIQFHPMKGPMTTQTLRGLLNLSPYHWRGDHPNFQAFNPAFNSLLGGSQLSTSDMNLYTAYINTLLFQPNPYENLDRSLPTSLVGGNPVNGQSDYVNLALTNINGQFLTCNQCHALPTGSNRFVLSETPQSLKNPQLRNIYQKLLKSRVSTPNGQVVIDGFGMDHEGDVSDFPAFFGAGIFAAYNLQQATDISAFMLALDTGTAPCVGYPRTLTVANVTSMAAQSDWTTLQSQAVAGNCDLIARGTLNGQVHALAYAPSLAVYFSDTGARFTQAQLQTFIQNGDTLTIQGVYPETGSALINQGF